MKQRTRITVLFAVSLVAVAALVFTARPPAPNGPLSKYIALDEFMKLAPDAALGVITVPESVKRLHVRNETSWVLLTAEKGRAKIPAGKWLVQTWTMKKTDAEGVKWSAEVLPRASLSITVSDGQETALDISDRFIDILEVIPAQVTHHFSRAMKGAARENVNMYRNDVPILPKLRITSADGSYDTALDFEFG